jgi:peptide/nickel transport system permease protein
MSMAQNKAFRLPRGKEAPGQGRGQGLGQNRRRLPATLWIAFAFLIPLVAAVALPGLFTSRSPTDFNYGAILQGPSQAHPFGTDHFGRDIFARVIYAARLDLKIGVVCVIFPFVFGCSIGALAGYFGGWLDSIVMRILDIVVSFPFFVLILAIIAILGPGITNIYIAISIVGWVSYARLVRGEVLLVKNLEFIQASEVLGYSKPRILLRHVLPNVLNPAIVFVVSDIVLCILQAASLSFLGMGVQPNIPEWGSMIADGRGFLGQAWWISVFPGLAILFTGIGLSLLGDSLADLLRVNQDA